MTEEPSGERRQPVLPQLRYDRPIQAVEWLGRVFGFTEEIRMSRPDGGLAISSLVSPGGGSVLICGPIDDSLRKQLRAAVPEYREVAERPWPDLSYSITVMVPDVDAHYEHARAHGARILVPPRDQPWGLRDYEALDLEGRQWNFSEHLRDATAQDWGASALD
jgi:uncharacterized glyoxalase superfamily protein PhnB